VPDFGVHGGGVRLSRAVDEDRALQLGEQAGHRPGRDLGFGDEGERADAAENWDVEPGDVVGEDERRRARGRTAFDLYPNAEQLQEQPVKELRQLFGHAPAVAQAQRLERAEHGENQNQDGEPKRDGEPGHDPGASASSSSGTA
jgi:hypothetical protein